MFPLLTFGFVPGVESLSLPISLTITSPVSVFFSSDIQATFVNIFLFWVSGVAFTSHSISIVSESSVVPSNASNGVVADVFLFNFKEISLILCIISNFLSWLTL